MSNMCKECEKRGKTWEGNDPVCAFDSDGKFQDNWNCATLNIIREHMLCSNTMCHGFDESLGVFAYENMFLILRWYKSRGRIDELLILNKWGDYMDMTDLEICEEIITNKINVLSEDK